MLSKRLTFTVQSIPLRPFRIFFENSRRYSHVKVHLWYQRHWRQIFPPFSLALLIPVANLPPVSTIPAAILQLATAATWNFFYLYANSTTHCTQRCQKKSEKNFLIKDFFHLPPANLELRISPRIFEKIQNGPNGIIRGLGETDYWKKPEAKNLVTLSL